jgi:hypothetical protein
VATNKGGFEMQIYCTYSEDFGDRVLMHGDSAIIDGYRIILNGANNSANKENRRIATDSLKNSNLYRFLFLKQHINSAYIHPVILDPGGAEFERSSVISIKGNAFICQFLNNQLTDKVFADLEKVDAKIIRQLIDEVFIQDEEKSPYVKYGDFIAKHPGGFLTASARSRRIYIKFEEKDVMAYTYAFDTVADFMLFLIQLMIEKKVRMRVCGNDECTRYFTPARSDSFYCENAAPQKPSLKCTIYMKNKNTTDNRRTDPAKNLYHKIFNILKNRIKRAPDHKRAEHEKVYAAFVSAAGERERNMSRDEYIEWLKDMHGKI